MNVAEFWLPVLIGLVGGTWVLIYLVKKLDGIEKFRMFSLVFLGYGSAIGMIVMHYVDHIATLLLLPLVLIIFFIWIKTPQTFYEKYIKKHFEKYFPKPDITYSDKVKADKSHKDYYVFDKVSEYSEEEIELIVGKRYQKFLSKWIKMEQTNKHTMFSWSPFFFSVFWYVYRKMWKLPLFVLLALYCLLFYIVLTGNRVEPVVFLMLYFMPGMAAYSSYRLEVLKKLSEIKHKATSEEEQRKLMKKKGGTSWLMVVAFIALFFFLEFLSTLILAIIQRLLS